MKSLRRVAWFLFLFTPLVIYAQAPSQPSEQPKAAVIRFFANVDPQTVGILLQTVDAQYKIGVRRFVLLLSSQGGDVLSGLMAYNYLKGLQIDLTTVNVGQVDSSAGIIFCAGSKRYSVPDARFLIHEVSLSVQANGPGILNIDLPSLEAQVSMLKSQESTIAKILAAAANKPQAEAEKKIHAQAAISAQEAKEWGLVQDIRTQLFDPADSNLVLSVPPQQPSTVTPQTTVPTVPQFSYSSKPQ
jgi:ATP-dependent Clp protease, protease subunit